MNWRDSSTRFGAVSVVLHWGLAVAIIGLFALGLYMMGLGYYDAWYVTAPNIHRSVGILVGLLMIVRVGWRWFSVDPVAQGAAWERFLGKLVHRLFYFIVFIIVISGFLISTAKGQPVSVFDWFEMPAVFSGIDNQEDIAGLVHEVVAYLMILLVMLHSSAALKHHFIDKDSTLIRMFGLKRASSRHVNSTYEEK